MISTGARPLATVIRKGLLLSGICLISFSTVSFAADWSATTRFSQSVEANDNRPLTSPPAKETYEFASQLMLSTIARLPGMRFEADADVSYRTLAGPGSGDSTSPIDNGVRLRAEKVDKLTKYYLQGVWRRQDATTAQIADSGIVIANGDINTYSVEAGLSRIVSPVDTLTWSVIGKSVDITGSSTASPFVDTTGTGTWTRHLNPTTDVFALAQTEWIARDDTAHTDTLFARALIGLDARLTKQLTFKGSVGAGLQRTDQDQPSVPSAPRPTGQSETWLADVQFTYRPLSETELSFYGARSISPSVIGEIEQRTTIGMGVRQGINHSSYLSLSSEFSRQISLDGLTYDNADVFRATVLYGYRLSPEWQAQLSYRYLHRSDDTVTAHSNAVFLSAVREVTILP
jgi:hypothetical protein